VNEFEEVRLFLKRNNLSETSEVADKGNKIPGSAETRDRKEATDV